MFTIDKLKVQHAFAAYTRQYDTDNGKVQLKITHTYRVAALCEQIARSLSLCDEDVQLAWLMGMLHDIGRFEQLRRYGTFWMNSPLTTLILRWSFYGRRSI